MKRYTRLRKRSKSRRSVLIRDCDALMFQLLKMKRGKVCEVCGKKEGLGTFHIMSKATHPRIRYSEDNLLLICFFPCHHLWHSDPIRARAIYKRIEEIRGKDFDARLRALNAISPPLDTFKLEQIKFALEHFVKFGETK